MIEPGFYLFGSFDGCYPALLHAARAENGGEALLMKQFKEAIEHSHYEALAVFKMDDTYQPQLLASWRCKKYEAEMQGVYIITKPTTEDTFRVYAQVVERGLVRELKPGEERFYVGPEFVGVINVERPDLED